MSRDFLLEIGTEEIPAGWLQDTSTQLANKICELLSKEGISHNEPEIFYTPRRIAVLIKNVATRQEDKSIEITGPPKEVAFDKNGNLTKAGIGFAKAHKVLPSELKVKKKGKQEVIYYQKLKKGEETSEILESALQDIISQIEFPKSMRWESSGFKFARPIRWIVALLDKTVIPFEIAGVKSGEKSQGLRGTPQITIKLPASYEEKLMLNGMIVTPEKRKELIVDKTLKLLEGKRLQPQVVEFHLTPILEEVTNLVECPRAILGKFDKKYLKLPKEVIVAAMETHQRYFPLNNPDWTLSSNFIVIVNTKAGNIDEIRKGHERVLRARLADAEFYFKEDMKIPLKKRIPELKEVVWQEGLGTLYDKTQRLIGLSKYIAQGYIPNANLSVLEKAAQLSKVDLLTNMIKDGKEFTKLEGLYGSILAKEQNLDSKVVLTIEMYSSPFLSVVSGPEAVALWIADRIDTIMGAFILGKIPTGSKDPLGVRRVGNELVSIIAKNNLHIPLKNLISKTLGVYEKVQSSKFEVQGEKIFEFLTQRFKKYSLDERIRYDIIDTVLEVPGDDIVDLLARVNALNELKDKEDFITLIRLAKRVRNILNKSQVSSLKSQVLKEPEEKELYGALMRGKDNFENYLRQKDYESALNWLLELAPLINNFFDKVLVMAKETDVRENRLALLSELYSSFQRIADFSKIVE